MAARSPHVIISFDMETDLGNWGTTNEGLRHGTPAIVEVLGRHRVPATFLFTADAAAACPEALQIAQAAGHEIGCHGLHHEFLGEANSDTPGIFTLLPEEIDHRLELATEAVAAAAGVRPVSFRCPRLQGSNQVILTLQRLGYLADSSYPTYFYAQRFGPYHPNRADWREPGDLSLLELPLFADFTATLSNPDAEFLRERDGWPLLRLEGGAGFKARIDRMDAYLAERGLPFFVCLYLHPWEFVPTPHELVFGEGRLEVAEWLWKNSGAAHLDALDELLGLLVADGAQFWTMKDFAVAWQRGDVPGNGAHVN
jgi:peptidoglycan-N-acetylglucosamine deacetylase